MNPHTLLALSPLVVRIVRIIGPIVIALLLLPVIVAAAILNKSTLAWPVAAPTQVADGTTAYHATGWTVSSPFGWRPDPTQPDRYELHEGIDLAGPLLCDGCAVPPLGDLVVTAVGWDRPTAANPLNSGAGVVVDMQLQHPEEAGDVRIRYGHLRPYLVSVRTRSCQEAVTCPQYQPDPAATITLTCAGLTVAVTDPPQPNGHALFAYATPGACTITVTWPSDYTPQGDTTLTFDQQMTPGVASMNAAVTFDATLPPPPPPIPTPMP